MQTWLVWFLIVYLIIYFSLAFLWQGWRTYKQTGINPYVFGNSDNVDDYIGLVFKAVIGLIVVVIVIYSFFASSYHYLQPLTWLEHNVVRAIGIGLLVLSSIWTLLAQRQMGASWRIGIDRQHPTDLVQQGIFRWSRNPIFLGMRLTMLGLFLILPNALTLLILVLGEILIQIQVRLEEQHLLTLHGERYRHYLQTTRRWLNV